MIDFVEVADRLWTARLDWHDVNVGVVGGERGCLVVDAHGSRASGRALAEAVRQLGAGPVLAVVHTHWHFDHTFGTGGLREVLGEVPVWSHEAAAEELAADAARVQQELAGSSDARDREAAGTEVVAPTETFSSVRSLDLGGRTVELLHPGRGHTAGDTAVWVADCEVMFAGDLVEESGPPAYGEDCFPMDWPLSLDFLLGLMTPGTVVVPGHGATVDQDFVLAQRGQVGGVAETIRDLASRGVPAAQALEAAEWPLPTEALAHAVTRGFEQLPRSQRRLPLV